VIVVDLFLWRVSGVVRSVYIVGEELATVSGGGDGGRVLVQKIDLLERQSLCLGNAEVREDHTARACRTPKEEHLDTKIGIAWTGVDQERGSVSDTEVPQPVGGSGERQRLGTNVEGVDFTNNDPSDGTPGGSETGDVQAHEGDKGFLTGLVVNGDGDTNDSDEELADTHPCGTPDEEGTTTESLDTPHAGDGHEHIDNVGSD